MYLQINKINKISINFQTVCHNLDPALRAQWDSCLTGDQEATGSILAVSGKVN